MANKVIYKSILIAALMFIPYLLLLQPSFADAVDETQMQEETVSGWEFDAPDEYSSAGGEIEDEYEQEIDEENEAEMAEDSDPESIEESEMTDEPEIDLEETDKVDDEALDTMEEEGPSAENTEPRQELATDLKEETIEGEASKDEDAVKAASEEDPLERLKREMEKLRIDRDNILIQMRIAYEQRDEAVGKLDEAYAQRNTFLEKYQQQVEIMRAKQKKVIQDGDSSEGYYEALTEESGVTDDRDFSEMQPPIIEYVEVDTSGFSSEERELYEMMKQDLDSALEVIEQLKIEIKVAQNRKNNIEERNHILEREIKELADEYKAITKAHKDIAKETEKIKKQMKKSPKDVMNLAKKQDQLKRENADLHYNLGVYFLNHRKYRDARNEFNRSLQHKPDDADTHFNLGLVYGEHLKEPEKAAYHFQRYLEIKPRAEDRNWVSSMIASFQAYIGEDRLV